MVEIGYVVFGYELGDGVDCEFVFCVIEGDFGFIGIEYGVVVCEYWCLLELVVGDVLGVGDVVGVVVECFDFFGEVD